jgi:polysaccharide export outer membrane protein
MVKFWKLHTVILLLALSPMTASGQLLTNFGARQSSAQSLSTQQGTAQETTSHVTANGYVVDETPFANAGGRCEFSANNPPMQPQVAKGRCQPCIRAVDCADNCGGGQVWADMHPYNFQPLGQGEYMGPVRIPPTTQYRVRIGDRIQFIFVRARQVPTDSYLLAVGDQLQITSLTDDKLKLGDITQGRGIEIKPDGYLTVPQIGEVRAVGLTIDQLRRKLELAYKEFLKEPGIDILPVKINSALEDLLEATNNRFGVVGGRVISEQVNPDGTARLPGLGAVCVQGLTLDEVKREINLRFRQLSPGVQIEPMLELEAPHFVFVYGQVIRPGRYQLQGPTTVTQALALAEGANIRANVREIVIFRRAEDWRYLATRVDLRGMHLGKVPTPADEIEVRDSDLIIVPLTPIARFNDFVEQVFQRGAYGIFPLAQLGAGFTATNSISR